MMPRHLRLLMLILLLSSGQTMAQVGGSASYDFLNLANSARVSASGGYNVSYYGQDVNQFINNPALLNSEMSQVASISLSPYYADITRSNLAYAQDFGNTGTWGIGLSYVGYGDLDRTDATGASDGTFSASDFAATITKSHRIDNYSIGAGLKLISSQYAGFGSTAMALDIGGAFIHPENDMTVGLAIRNIGFSMSEYVDGSELDLPFDVQAGITFKPEKMPVRFTVTAHHLHQWDIAYDDPNKKLRQDANGDPVEEKISTTDKVARHLSGGLELLLGKHLSFRAGYNHLVRREMALEDRSGLTGFSLGGWIKINAFDFGLSRAYQYVGGGTTTLTLTADLNRFIKRKEDTSPPLEIGQ